jgi:hypothetical protein
MRTQQEIETAIYTLLEEYEHYDSMEHRMFLDELSESCLTVGKSCKREQTRARVLIPKLSVLVTDTSLRFSV